MTHSALAENEAIYSEGGVGTTTLDLLEGARAYNRWIVDFIRPRLGANNIELGAGHGTLCDIVGESHRVLPFEVSEHNRRVLQSRFAGHPRVAPSRGNILDCQEWGSFSCVYSANVLEHILDDLAVLRHCARLLEPGGWFVAFVPAGRWLYSKFDRELGHYRRYGRRDRHRLSQVVCGEMRLTLRQYRYVNAVGAFGWFVKMRLLQQCTVSARDTALVQRLLPVIKFVDALGVPWGQSVIIALERERS